ncbi:MAG TPA: NAD(P)/FAD-dependent oxidoreductase, partial [Actinomycetota bacterium]|nr:NAD(P)/FAD-dependent oxidoreductase [Actinomycetota bacterium]
SSRPNTIVVGAGHNGLVAAAYLAKAGRRVLVLERADEAGGILRGPHLAEGFRAPGIVPTVGRLRASVVRDLKLAQHGFETVAPDVRMFAPQPDGPGVTFWAEPRKTAEGLRALSPHDADAFEAFDAKVRTIASFLSYVNAATPPDPKGPSLADAIMGLKLGKAFRDLGAEAGREAVRALPMAVADLVQEVFESEVVRGSLATRGVLFTSMDAWAAGTAAVFLNDSAGNDGGAAGTAVFARGGTRALAEALASAARSCGAEIRTGAEVARIRSRDGRVVGVTLVDGDEVDGDVVVSAADPKRTLLMCDPLELGPTLVWQAGNIRQPGATAKVDLALSGLPSFNGVSEGHLRGRIVIGPSIDDVERAMDAAKYGRVTEDPILEATIPSLVDPSLAPEGKHVMSVVFQAAPRRLREAAWSTERDRVGDIAVKALERFAPGLDGLIEARSVITPEDMEAGYGLSGGHVLHAEPGLDQFFAWRPLNGHARYAFGLPGLYLAGSGAHPGGGITGGPGANAARQILRDLRRV